MSRQQLSTNVASENDVEMNLNSTIRDEVSTAASASTGSYHPIAAVTTPPPPPTTTMLSQQHQAILSSLPENRFELELEFIQALASPAYIHFLVTSRSLDDPLLASSSSTATTTTQQQSTLQQLQPFLHYLYKTYSQPEYARFLRYPHALFFLESLLVYDDDAVIADPKGNNDTANNNSIGSSGGTTTTTSNNKLWVEWTVPSFRNFCHQQQFLAWQYRHATCYGVGSIASMMNTSATITNTSNLHQEEPATTEGIDDDNDDMDDDDE